MTSQFLLPKRECSSLIAQFSVLEVSSAESFTSNGLTLPDGFVEIYFSRFDAVSVKTGGDEVSQYSDTGFVIGQSTEKIEFAPSGKLELISLKIQPWAASVLLPGKASLYKGKAMPIDDLNSPMLDLLQRKVLHSKTKNEAFGYIEKFVVDAVKTNRTYSELVRHSINYIFQNYRSFSVKAVCRWLNVSRQYLERKFIEQVGLTPKQFARVVRIRSLANYFKTDPKISLTELCYKFGYFDQSHFIRDFRLVAGTAPRKFFSSNNMVSSNYVHGPRA